MRISCCWLYAVSKYGYPPKCILQKTLSKTTYVTKISVCSNIKEDE